MASFSGFQLGEQTIDLVAKQMYVLCVAVNAHMVAIREGRHAVSVLCFAQ
jgi:hypothetical protein